MKNKNSISMLIKLKALIVLLLISINTFSQVSVVNTNLYPFNVTPSSMIQMTIMNSSGEAKVIIDATVFNASNNALLRVKTAPVTLKTGVNVITKNNVSFTSISYAQGNQGTYVKTKHQLPSGAYNYCVVLTPVEGLEEGDEYCQEIDAVDNEFLYLVFPNDKDTIETPNPVLTWTHSEPFNILSEGEFFRLVVVKLDDDQSAEAGVTANKPVFMKNYVGRHQVPYPPDAEKLEAGARYGWQVQKLSKGNIINKTEAWEFTLVDEHKVREHMFSTLKRKLDGGFYHVFNDKIYFKFDEKYSAGSVNCKILNEKREVLKPEMENVGEEDTPYNAKSTGYNQYVFDLTSYNLEPGFYILEAYNGKGEKFQLKFYVKNI